MENRGGEGVMAKREVLLVANKGGRLELFLRWGNTKNLRYFRTVPYKIADKNMLHTATQWEKRLGPPISSSGPAGEKFKGNRHTFQLMYLITSFPTFLSNTKAQTFSCLSLKENLSHLKEMAKVYWPQSQKENNGPHYLTEFRI